MSAQFTVYQTERGDYAWRLVGQDGKTVSITPGTIGGKYSARQRKADRDAVQAGLKFLFEQQAAAS